MTGCSYGAEKISSFKMLQTGCSYGDLLEKYKQPRRGALFVAKSTVFLELIDNISAIYTL